MLLLSAKTILLLLICPQLKMYHPKVLAILIPLLLSDRRLPKVMLHELASRRLVVDLIPTVLELRHTILADSIDLILLQNT